jgi:hypothetical protein
METRMSRFLLFMTAAVALTVGGQALAQQPAKGVTPPSAMGHTPPDNPPATASTSPATNTPTATTPAAASADQAAAPASATVSAPLSVGLSVKDNTGVVIGQITALKPDASGKDMATVKMASGSFAVVATSLTVDNGAALINLTQAQLNAMIKKPG